MTSLRLMSCEEFFWVLDNDYEFDPLLHEMKFADDFQAKVLFDHLKRLAEKYRVKLTDVDDFDYETFFWDHYDNVKRFITR